MSAGGISGATTNGVVAKAENGVIEKSSGMTSVMATSTSSAIGTANSGNTNGIERLRLLEALFLGGPISAHEAKCFSTETLLDVLLVLFSECNQSSLRKEKTVTEFIDLGTLKLVVFNACQLYLKLIISQNVKLINIPLYFNSKTCCQPCESSSTLQR